MRLHDSGHGFSPNFFLWTLTSYHSLQMVMQIITDDDTEDDASDDAENGAD